MNIKTKRSISKKLLLLLALITGVLVMLFIYLYSFHGNIYGWQPFGTASDSSGQYGPPTEEQIKAGDEIKKQNIKENTSKSSVPSTTDQSAGSTPQAKGKSVVDIYLTVKNQTSDGLILQIHSDISTVTNAGTCTLSLTKDGKTVTKTASVQAMASSSTCKGFDIPVSELSQGSWNLTLHFENDSLTADTTDTVVVQ